MSSAVSGSTMLGLLVGAVLLTPSRLQPQTPPPLRACYVPGSGTVYRVGAPDTPTRCAPDHVEFALGAALAATAADPYPQYVLTDGVRQGNNGFAVTDNTATVGTIPASGAGKRLMWYTEKAAFRAGLAEGAAWDASNTGFYSVAMGRGTHASGIAATALGAFTVARGTAATALGYQTSVSGDYATALGYRANASGDYSTAAGYHTSANGSYTTALGRYASTNGKAGSFIYGDASTSSYVLAASPNQFVVRAQRVWFGNNNAETSSLGRFLETSTGAYLSLGGTWTNASDAARKHRFRPVDGEEVLGKVASLPIRTWSYRDEEATVRHVGPTAQDFRAAFGLGDGDRAIATVDAEGVSLVAIQALERRTTRLREANDALRAENRDLRRAHGALRAQLARVLQRLADVEAAQRIR